MYDDLVHFIKQLYQTQGVIPLHEPTFTGRDRELIAEAIDSTYVSSIGPFVDRFETDLETYTGAKRAIVTVNGTTALQVALRMVGVKTGDEVITQPLTFVATANAISHQGAAPIFLDVSMETMGLSPAALETFLKHTAKVKNGGAYNTKTNRRISAIVPMHTFGHPCEIKKIVEIANDWAIPVVEDAAEALGSWFDGQHCGTFGVAGILSFNGNKVITSGGGGAILTNDDALATRAKHLITTAKRPHPWEFDHDEIGYNFRMPNLNAALACAQLERITTILGEKRAVANAYKVFFRQHDWACYCEEPPGAMSNFWLNTVLLSNEEDRNTFLAHLNRAGVMSRPAWKLMTDLSIYRDCFSGPLNNARVLQKRAANLPSGVRTYAEG
jgi:aminotransferase in exopolysaccharide biosynthesis